MANYYPGQTSPHDFSEEHQQPNGQEDVAMGSMDMAGQGFSGTHLQQSMSGNTSPVASGGVSSHADNASGGRESTQGSNHHQHHHHHHQNVDQIPNLMQNSDLNNFQFNPQNVLGHNFMPDFQSQQGQQQSQQSQQAQQQQQNNIMSQIMFQNAYANMLQNQSIAMRMNPNAMQNFNLDLSDPNVIAAVKNNMASLNLQNQMLSNMAMNPMLQNVSMGNSSGNAGNGNDNNNNDNNNNNQQIQGMPNANNIQQHNNDARRPTALNSTTLAQSSPAHYSQPSSPAIHSGRESNHESLQRRASISQSRPDRISHNPQQNRIAQNLFMQQPGSENMANPAFSVGQGDVSNVDLGNANPYPSAVKLNQNSYRDAYSSTGFDMLTVLMRVATRKDPFINIGAVDLSCAFVVCDVLQHDIPIVYCSDNFERLTGYTKHEILGRNCRFLQSPSGHVSAGVKRKYVDDDTVLHLKNTINGRQEAQVSVINYRKGGQPFMNLLTMIPVSYSDGEDIQFYVGFQVDLVEQPHSVTSKNSDGTYTVNYQRGLTMPRYVFTEKDQPAPMSGASQTISRDEVSTVLATVGSGDSELSKRVWDKVLLENTDDVVFVLSLKGLFLYLSPSSSRVLEYEPSELTSTALSSVCHPSDIVPVTRELKDTANGATASVVFRIRRKTNGYMWFEGHGSLYTEQGKGRKSIVLVGRERPVYTLKEPDISASGGYGENEVWTKLSTSGMFLFVSSSIRSLLDKQPHELVGTSIQSLMRPDSRAEFGRILEIARSGRRAQTRHELLNRRGQVLQAFSTLYPGDASEGTKPTFFVAQTRLLKFSRQSTSNQATGRAAVTAAPQPENAQASQQRASADPSRPKLNPTRSTSSTGSAAGTPNHMMSTFETISTHAGQDSLPLGNQGEALAHEANMFDELKTTRSTSWQFELRQMERHNRLLAEELQRLLAARKKRKRRKGAGVLEKECSNCHTKQTPEWRRGPSGNRDLCNSCGLRWAKQQGRISPRTSGHRSNKSVASGKSAKSEKSGGGSPLSQSGGHSAGQSGGQSRGASGSAGAESGGGEARSIDETLAQSVQQGQRVASAGSAGESAGSNARMSDAVGDTQTVSKAAKTEDAGVQPDGDPSQIERSGVTGSVSTKIEDN